MSDTEYKPDPQMPGFHYRDLPHGRLYMPSWIVEAGIAIKVVDWPTPKQATDSGRAPMIA